ESACHNSIIASGTGTPSPSSTRKVSSTLSPFAPSLAIREILPASVRPRCRYGPTVCEGVGVKSIVMPAIYFQTALIHGHATRCRNDNPKPTPASSFPGRISIPNADEPFRQESIAEWDRKQRADRQENTS